MARRSIRFDDQHLVPAHNLKIANKAFAADAAGMVRVRKKPRDMSVRDWAIYLLHNGAEVEHALMVQYLFAMYSLNSKARNPSNPPLATPKQWALIIRGIAVEEMGHLLTIQNILRFVGGPMCFDREDFPIPTNIYPFAFELEPLTKDSLAKYVFAEMPGGDVSADIMTAVERAEIEQRAKAAAGVKQGDFLNHVGNLYATLLDVFDDPSFNNSKTAGFPPNTAMFQQNADDYDRTQGNNSIIGIPSLLSPRVLTIESLQDVKDALNFIASQGEASSENPTDSHFERFLKIYREFPEPNASGWNIPPIFPVSRNPTTVPSEPGSILHPITQLWARLFDVRYRMLLMSLVHITALPVRDGSETTMKKKDALISWIFSSFMLRAFSLSISNLAVVLAQMPSARSTDAPTAGAPYGMPYSLAIPDQEPERWQYHLDLISSSDMLVAELQKVLPQMAADPLFAFFDNPNGKLDNLVDDDSLRRTTISEFLKSN